MTGRLFLKRSCRDLTAVSGVTGLLEREAHHAQSQLSEGRFRPGGDEVQLDLFGDYKSNVALY
jgi:hypothetical protein